MNKKDTFCVIPSIHLSIKQNGDVMPCCLSKNYVRKEDDSIYNINTDSISDAWNSQSLQTLREDLSNGKKVSNCEQCWQNEDAGYESKRQMANEKLWVKEYDTIYKDINTYDAPKWFELHLTNLCNLKCRICSYKISTEWIKEHSEIHGKDSIDKQYLTKMHWAKDKSSGFWAEMHKVLENIEHFDFYGGEPLLIKAQFDLIKESVTKGYAKKQTIHYNTNGTIFPDDIAHNVWPEFKNVDIMLSIDDIGDRFEYQRKNAIWDEVTENIQKYKALSEQYNNITLTICCTVNIFNVMYLPEYTTWAKDVGIPVWLNVLHYPHEYSVNVFPDNVKKAITKKLNNFNFEQYADLSKIYRENITPFINLMNNDTLNKADFEDTIELITTHDEYRNESFATIYPELWTLMKHNSYKNGQ